jgi:hypothetical protein
MAEKGLFCGINIPKDLANLSDMEKKHLPVIEAPDEVKAGEPFQATLLHKNRVNPGIYISRDYCITRKTRERYT